MAADATSNVAEYSEGAFEPATEDRELDVDSGESLEFKEG